MYKLTRRGLILGAGAFLGYTASNRLGASLPSTQGTHSLLPSTRGYLNDASELNPTPIYKHITITDDPSEQLVRNVRAAIKEAEREGLPVNLGAARHSMGGQAIPRDGIALTYDNAHIEVDTNALTYQTHAGARWSDVISTLDPMGFGPKVMQSNNDFGVAATYCVNAHGWPAPYGPMGHTVRSVEMVLADGTLITASRTQNSDIFYAAMGGYGLLGVITKMEVEMASNARLEPVFQKIPARELGTAMLAALKDPNINMIYGRLNVDRERFFEDALLISYFPSDDQSELPAASGSGAMAKISSRIYRAQLGNEFMKRARWKIESDIGPKIGGGGVTRNSLINEPVVTLDDRDPSRTDILHEYFVAPERFAEFIDVCQRVIPASYQEFLNVTLRFVKKDTQSLLSYAPTDRIAAVMSFSQELTARAEADMARLTRELIDGVHSIGGSYYLPYRPHATIEQFNGGYPNAQKFAAFKRNLDPGLRFKSLFWDNYLENL